MIIREEAGRKNAAAEANPYHWPKSYYMEDDGEKRKELLDQELAANTDDPSNRLRLELWNIRYERLKNGNLSDQYMWKLIDLVQISRDLNKTFGKNSQKKRALDDINFICNDRIDHFGTDLVTEELKHLLLTYGMMCLTDKNYGSHLFGLFRMNKSTIEDKLGTDLQILGEKLPQSLGLEKEFCFFTEAAKQTSIYLGLR